MNDINHVIRKRYDRVSAIYNWMDRMIKPDWRKDLISTVSGAVLEVGAGTGANFRYYLPGTQVTGIDFSKGMLNKAREEVYRLNMKDNIHLIEMDAQKLDFPDHSFDYIVSTCVFCSVPDPLIGLKEIRRVCKPEGKIVMLEHMRSENPALGRFMDLLNPIVVRLWGANINRRTLDTIQNAGMAIEKDDRLFGTILHKLVVRPNR